MTLRPMGGLPLSRPGTCGTGSTIILPVCGRDCALATPCHELITATAPPRRLLTASGSQIDKAAERLGLIQNDGRITISGLRAKAATDIALVADDVFFYRNEWSALTEQYGLTFADRPLARHTEVYDRLKEGRDDKKAVVAVGYGTDKELNPIAPDLVQIEDDRKVFPTYYAGPLVNRLLLRKFPKVEPALSRLKGILSSQEMARLLKKHDKVTANLKSVEAKKKAVEDIAREFLLSKGVLAKS